MMKKIILLVIFIIAVINIPSLSTFAQEEMDDSTESAQTEEINSIREKVQEKIEQVRSNPKAYLGTVTDITEETIQIKGGAEEILQISVDEENTNFVNIGKKTTTVNFEDVAIGDYIVAMGFENGNGVLEAKRVLITPPIEPVARTILLGKVTEIDGKTLYLTDGEQEEYILEFPRRWKGPETKEFEESMTVIAVFESDEDELTIRTIEIISEPEASPTPEETEE